VSQSFEFCIEAKQQIKLFLKKKVKSCKCGTKLVTVSEDTNYTTNFNFIIFSFLKLLIDNPLIALKVKSLDYYIISRKP